MNRGNVLLGVAVQKATRKITQVTGPDGDLVRHVTPRRAEAASRRTEGKESHRSPVRSSSHVSVTCSSL